MHLVRVDPFLPCVGRWGDAADACSWHSGRELTGRFSDFRYLFFYRLLWRWEAPIFFLMLKDWLFCLWNNPLAGRNMRLLGGRVSSRTVWTFLLIRRKFQFFDWVGLLSPMVCESNRLSSVLVGCHPLALFSWAISREPSILSILTSASSGHGGRSNYLQWKRLEHLSFLEQKALTFVSVSEVDHVFPLVPD